jgi:hypothetical protein
MPVEPSLPQAAGMTASKHLTYANIMATVAVVIATAAGTSYAAEKIKIPKNSVASKQIKDGTVGTKDLADGAVDSTKLNAGTAAGFAKPRAWGTFKGSGELLAGRSSGNVTVTKVTADPGKYCVVVAGVDPLTTSIVVTPDYQGSGGLGHFAQTYDAATGSPSGICANGFGVITHYLNAGTAAPEDGAVSFIVP